MIINLEEIKELIPHRDPFLFVDKCAILDPGKKGSSERYFSEDEYFFKGHFPNNPIVPGVIIVEAMAQASGILGFKTMDKKPEDGSIYYFVGADDLRFKRPAVPGDKLILNSKVLTNKKGIWKFECSATVENDLVAKATILCADRPK